MKIHSICLVKNESDVISHTLNSAIEWSDFIYVYDNGSTDGTWEQVLKLAEKYKQIIPYKQNYLPFKNSMRGEVFNHYRENSSEGDWWCRLDADEIYIDDPRIFLAKIPKKYKVVVNAAFEYYFTDKDLELYNHNPSLYADDVPLEQKYRYYFNQWSEIRFIRYNTDIVWKETDGGWPSTIWQAPIYPVRIWMKHYQYRSPNQIQKRLDNRREAVARREGFAHEAQANWQVAVTESKFLLDLNKLENHNIPSNWQERILESSKLYYDDHDRKYIVREDLMPEISEIKVESTSSKTLALELLKRFVNKFSCIIKKLQAFKENLNQLFLAR